MLRRFSGGAVNPFQMLSVALIEGALVAAIYPSEAIWLKAVLIVSVVIIAVSFAGTIIYINIYLLHKNPNLLYNPADYDKAVQPLLFSNTKLAVEIPEEIGSRASSSATALESGLRVTPDK